MGTADVDLSLAQYRVLGHLAEVDTAAASALAGRLEVSRPSVTALIDGLEARGLVERRGCAEDRRRVELRLTPAGARALRAADRAVEARLNRLGTHLSPAERAGADAGVDAWGVALNRARDAHLGQAGVVARTEALAGGRPEPTS